MSEETVSVSKTRKTRATKDVAENSPVENVSVEEAATEEVNDDGQKVITGPKKQKPTRKSNVHANDENTISSHAANSSLTRKVPPAEQPKKKEEKVALWSTKNIRWSNVGIISKGYNIVSKEAAEKWLQKEGIREATPQEVASYYGV